MGGVVGGTFDTHPIFKFHRGKKPENPIVLPNEWVLHDVFSILLENLLKFRDVVVLIGGDEVGHG